MQTPEEVLVMRQLLERGWSRRRIAAELGMSRNTLDRYMRLDEWQPYSTLNRPGRLDEHRQWLQQQFVGEAFSEGVAQRRQHPMERPLPRR